MSLSDQDWKSAYIGIGSNLDNPARQVQNAMDILDGQEGCRVTKRSSLYASAPIGFAEQPRFINAACQLTTHHDAFDLMRLLQRLEDQLGRIRTAIVNGPRSIDLDLLLYEDERIVSPELTVPHPRMHQRRFVLEPLIEIEPEIIIPMKGRALDFLIECRDQQVEKN